MYKVARRPVRHLPFPIAAGGERARALGCYRRCRQCGLHVHKTQLSEPSQVGTRVLYMIASSTTCSVSICSSPVLSEQCVLWGNFCYVRSPPSVYCLLLVCISHAYACRITRSYTRERLQSFHVCTTAEGLMLGSSRIPS